MRRKNLFLIARFCASPPPRTLINFESIWTRHGDWLGNRRVSLGGVSEEILSHILHAEGRIFWQFYVLALVCLRLYDFLSFFLFIEGSRTSPRVQVLQRLEEREVLQLHPRRRADLVPDVPARRLRVEQRAMPRMAGVNDHRLSGVLLFSSLMTSLFTRDFRKHMIKSQSHDDSQSHVGERRVKSTADQTWLFESREWPATVHSCQAHVELTHEPYLGQSYFHSNFFCLHSNSGRVQTK